MEEGFEDFVYDPFDWSDVEDFTIDEEGGEGAFDSEGGIEPDAVETETIESANSASEDAQEQSATFEEQEANTNTINETEAEQEDYGTPVDLSWISTSDLSEEEKNDLQISSNVSDDPFADFVNNKGETWAEHEAKTESKAEDKADTKVDAAKEDNIQYPNGMTKEEFNAMYEFALGMTGRGGNQVLDVNGDQTGYWGSFETLPLTIEETQQEIEKLETRLESAKSESQATALEERIAESQTNLEQAREQLDTLNAFLDNYAEIYTPIETEDQKEQVVDKVAEAEKEVDKAFADRNTAWAEYFQSLTKAGLDGETFHQEVLASSSSYPEEVVAAAQAVADANENYIDKEAKYEAALSAASNASHAAATDSKQDVMDRYARGEINAYQAAVELSNIKDSIVNFNYNAITSNIDYDNFKDGKVAGSTDKGTVGIDSLISDLQPAGRDNSASATNISKDITIEFKNLNELKDTLSKVDTSNAKDLQSFNELKTQVENINVQLDQLASNAFLDLAKDLLGKGIELAELDKQPEMQQLNNEIYALAQMVLDKASELKEISGQYGLNNLTMKELKENRGAYSAQVALITGKNGVTLLDKSDMRALVNYSKSLDATIDSAKALMTAAAVLHGAQDVQGGKYSQAWKAEAAEQKLTAKEWLATAATSTLSLFATIVGFGMMAANPLVGGALAFAGTKSLIEKTGKTVGRETTAHLTNYERMFGSKDKAGASVIANIYDRGFNQSNYGDIKSVGTYTTMFGSTIDALNAMTMLTNPVTAIAGLGYLYNAGKSMTVDLAKGSYEGKKNNLITNIWQVVENIEEWANTYLGSQELAELINAGATTDIFETEDREGRKEGRSASSDYGTTEGEAADNADKYYSGASEQAKNANLAKDYNAGMEQETNEAVSDRYVKVFKVMLDKEPDYIRKVLIAIPKNHSEREWK